MDILITAGGTKEPIDAVRVLTNISSGSLGRALCVAAAAQGHRVLLLAPSELPRLAGPLPPGVEHRPFRSAADLERELLRSAEERRWDLVIHAAAVSDYRPAEPYPGKISSETDELVLKLVRTPKLIARLREWFGTAYLVGFKLSSGLPRDERLRLAREQIQRNGTDACVENDLAEFGPGEHQARIVVKSGDVIAIPKADKASAAQALFASLEQAQRSA